MSPMHPLDARFYDYLNERPIIAILRGVTPAEVIPIGKALISAGIRIIEISLNSPNPFESIRLLSETSGPEALIGAGTVFTARDVARVKDAGGELVVSPNTDGAVIEATRAAQMISVPGFFTPSEAFAAIHAGAHAIKLFPAEAASPAVVKAQRAVLPKNIPLLVVGGVTADDTGSWLSAGANGFGLGSALYCPGQTASQVHDQALRFVSALSRRDQS